MSFTEKIKLEAKKDQILDAAYVIKYLWKYIIFC